MSFRWWLRIGINQSERMTVGSGYPATRPGLSVRQLVAMSTRQHGQIEHGSLRTA
jgi:hypothetical protein